ncbi:MAG: hypothetical protein ABSE48_18490 [Verrucomicrobiota bacterium]
MNVKRWFAWACLALMLVAEILLFQANRQKDAALIKLRDTQAQLRQTDDALSALKNSDVGLQASEILRLRKQNEILTNRFAALESSVAQMSAEDESNAQHLATARLALQLQADHLQELEAQNQQIQIAAESNASNAAAIIAQQTCLSNLRRIDDAKQQWAADNDEADNAVPKAADLLKYLKSGVFPVCPCGGTYSINPVNEVPTCSYPGHVLRE